MLRWINARYAGNCWLCRARIERGFKCAYIETRAANGCPGSRLCCTPCGNAYAARMAEREESVRDAYAHGKRMGGGE